MVAVLCVLSYLAGASTRAAVPHDVPPQPACDETTAQESRGSRSAANERPTAAVPAPQAALRCPPPPDVSTRLHPSDTIVAAADALPDLLATWDAGVAETLFDDIELGALEQQLAWMHARVGRCGPPAPMGNATASSGRFAYVCEHGVVEASFAASDPSATSVARMRAGVRDAAPPAPVSAAGDTFAALIDDWNPDTFDAQFSNHFRAKLGEGMPDFARSLRDKLGACALGPVDLASSTGAVFVLDCDNGRRTMVVNLDEDQRIGGLKVVPLRRDPRD